MRTEYETPLDGHQLAAFAAVIELGSFDAAAERLHVTPSAISQSITALEQRVGQVLVVREKPCTATQAGVPLLRLAAQTAMLESQALAEMGGTTPRSVHGSQSPSTPTRWPPGLPGSSADPFPAPLSTGVSNWNC